MEEWQVSVLVERHDLERKREKLLLFTQSQKFASLSRSERDLIQRQLRSMEDYSNILKARILGFDGSPVKF